LADWRGNELSVATTWSDSDFDNASNAYQLDPGAEYGDWSGSLDWAPGGIWAGDSWSEAAQGGYDSKWTQMLENVKAKWESKPRGTLFIRFAHEMNGFWFDHSVQASEIDDFVASWRRFHAIKQAVFPDAQLVFNTNANTNTAGESYDWRELWPGDAYVDVYSTDWYSNHWIVGGTYDDDGAPQGLEQHRQFAEEHGKPFAVSEWGNNGEFGDQPDYIRYMHDFFQANSGSGPGQLLYECLFTVTETNNQFSIFPGGQSGAPEAAAVYQELF
jgi:hypothetical protein